MTINDISMLAVSEQDAYSKKQTSNSRRNDDSDTGFFNQLEDANKAAYNNNSKAKAGASNAKAEQPETQDDAVSGDSMLAQINAAHTIDTSVKKNADAKAEALDEDAKQLKGKPDDQLAPIVIAPQKGVLSDVAASAEAANEKLMPLSQSMATANNKGDATAQKQSVDAAVMNLLSKDSEAIKADPLLAKLTPEQHEQLTTQLQASSKPNGNDNLATLKQMLTQYVVESDKASAADTAKQALNSQINALTTPEKQALLSQLNSYIKNEQPQGEQLASIKQTIADLSASIDKKALNALSDKELTKSLESLQKNNTEQLSPRAAQLLTQITSTVNGLGLYDSVGYEQTIIDMQALQAGQLQSTAQVKQASLDPGVMQALNIIKSDAAKMLQERVSSMLSINNKVAEIRLDPPEMGSMQIRIRSDAEQAQINFVVQNQQAKEALEQSLPRLREMLAQQGIDLGESTISYGEPGGQGAEQNDDNDSRRLANNELTTDENDEQINTQMPSSRQQTSSSIDYYA
ncbi:flagellar hook-length control protein FliK [Pseudoalteromonas sp. HL-AS2]|uniref:flagellar hook-length control protein FliK n=1 Tax=Pseudoalteromonas sp. HL-AS2 TaxID=3071082 RepID=UPI0028163E5D|nr:flagellar hook-length control protein FliK [Pseudoalteromonas sp. HL-AS2]WMS95249.1 flagellar hook-length control protein FliK [Pseudoalteromonas sp. HL-AS2]